MTSCSRPVWVGSMIMSRTRPVIRRTSQVATRPRPSAVGTRRWEIAPLSVPASIARTCWCMCGGKKSMRRLTVSAASTVWTVEKTRWPVSAALSAVWTVSSSRISPMRMTSGSWRRTRRRACLNEVGVHADLALVDERALVGVQELDRVLDRDDVLARVVVLMWSIIAASVVDLPEPVVPVTRMMPRSSSASSA